MDVSPLKLPPEVWTYVFGYLSVSDKLTVRAVCKYFRKLVDQHYLWRGWAAVLTFRNRSYTSGFWESLRRRKVSGVVVRSPKAKNWRQLSSELPDLSAVVLEQGVKENLGFGKDFPHLEHLAIRNSEVVIDSLQMPHFEQLTHLSLCDVTFPVKSSFLSLFSCLKNITSLAWHNSGPSVGWTIDAILSYLPELKHLSLSCKSSGILVLDRSAKERIYSLSTLELVEYSDGFFQEDTMKRVPHLKSLSVVSAIGYQFMPSATYDFVHLLNCWLNDLPELHQLAVTRGPPVWMYASSIPATVSSLTLRHSFLSTEDMSSVSEQLPNLLHLHIDQFSSPRGPNVAQFPELFPKLRSLRLRYENLPEEDLLHLHRLQNLERLELLVFEELPPHLQKLVARTGDPSRLADQLKALTENRLRVSSCPPQNDRMLCACIF